MENHFYILRNGRTVSCQHGIHTFPLGIGEWFLGALIILYLLFPLLRLLMKKNPCLFFIGSTCIYLLLLFYYPFHTPVHVNLLIKGYDFVLGMLLGYTNHKFRPQWAFLSVPLVIFFFVSPFRLGIHHELESGDPRCCFLHFHLIP